MPSSTTDQPLILAGLQSGLTLISTPTPLKRLHYFDGKFLRAQDLTLEQDYLRALVAQSNQGGGAGVVHGFDVNLGAGDTLVVNKGLAIDSKGRVLFFDGQAKLSIAALIDASRPRSSVSDSGASTATGSGAAFDDCQIAQATAASTVAVGTDLYLISVGHAEAYCGQEEVFGRLCEEACVTNADRPYLLDGIVLRATPYQLQTPLVTSAAVTLDDTHRRSRIASAYFADERLRVASLISKDGLASGVWCKGAAPVFGSDVPLGVLARTGTSTLFFDAWTARRERIEAPARRYWAVRMAMRPWDVYLAQILQFQCQLAELLPQASSPTGSDDPCAARAKLIGDAATTIGEASSFYEAMSARIVQETSALETNDSLKIQLADMLSKLRGLGQKLGSSKDAYELAPTDRVLIRGGIVGLSPAGYLPVAPGAGASVDAQVRQLLGEGLDLRFCVVRPDYVAHALEEAQHMDRISLLQGLDNPDDKPKVDILVPDGEVVLSGEIDRGIGFEFKVQARVDDGSDSDSAPAPVPPAVVQPAPSVAQPAPRNVAMPPTLSERSTSAAEASLPPQGALAEPRRVLTASGAVRVALLQGGGASLYAAASEDTRFVTNRYRKASAYSTATVDAVSFRATAIGATRVRDAASTPVPLGLDEISAGTKASATPVGTNTLTRLAAWAEMTIASNPFAAHPASTIKIDGQAELSSPRDQLFAHIVFHGSLNGVQAVAGAPAGTLKGEIVGVGSVSGVEEGDAFSDATNLRMQVQFSLTTFGTRSKLSIVLIPDAKDAKEAVQAIVEFTPDGEKVVIQVSLLENNQVNQDVATVIASKQAAVFDPSNAYHKLAEQGIELVGMQMAAVEHDTTFPDEARQLLFSSGPAAPVTRFIQATRDWVLFHRRRDKDCGGAMQTTLSPNRTYQVWHYAAKDVADAARIASFVASSGIGEIQNPFSYVDQVEFAGDAVNLLTAPAAVNADWGAILGNPRPGTVFAAGVVGTPGTSESLLETTRVTRLLNALSSTLVADSDIELLSFDAIPNALTRADSDGAILLITADDVASYAVYETDVDSNADGTPNLDRIVEILHKSPELAASLIERQSAGNVAFSGGTFATDAATVVAAWSQFSHADRVAYIAIATTDTLSNDLSTKRVDAFSRALVDNQIVRASVPRIDVLSRVPDFNQTAGDGILFVVTAKTSQDPKLVTSYYIFGVRIIDQSFNDNVKRANFVSLRDGEIALTEQGSFETIFAKGASPPRLLSGALQHLAGRVVEDGSVPPVSVFVKTGSSDIEPDAIYHQELSELFKKAGIGMPIPMPQVISPNDWPLDISESYIVIVALN